MQKVLAEYVKKQRDVTNATNIATGQLDITLESQKQAEKRSLESKQIKQVCKSRESMFCAESNAVPKDTCCNL